MQNDANCCDISLYKILMWVGGVVMDGWGGVWWVMQGWGWGGVWWVMQGWGGSYRGRVGWVGHGGVGWGMVGHAGWGHTGVNG